MSTAVARLPKPSEMASLVERMTYLCVMRATFVVVMIASRAFFPDVIAAPTTVLALVSLVYLATTLLAEGARRLVGSQGLRFIGLSLMIDVLFLSWAVFVSGGTQSPLRFLVFIHLITVTILASYRTGLKLALWHSLLIFLVAYFETIGLLVPSGTLGSLGDASLFQQLSVFNVTAFWLVALGAAAVSSINERELRRRKVDLEGLAEMTSDLEGISAPVDIAPVILRRVVEHFDLSRGVLLGGFDEELRVLAHVGIEAPSNQPVPPDPLVKRAWEERSALLVKELSGETDPVISSLLGSSRNIIITPLIAEGRPVGAIALEFGGNRSRVPRHTVNMITQFAFHAAMVLRNAWLMSEVHKMAHTDALTGVANRRAFEETLMKEIAIATRDRDQVTLVLVDVDHFKDFNDTFGHRSGDEVLQSVGAALGGCTGEFDMVARYGGEEFAIILPSCSAEASGLAAERLREAVSGIDAPCKITASAGVATFPHDATDVDSLIRAADQALYTSKACGRDQVTLYRRRAEARPVVPVEDERRPDGNTRALAIAPSEERARILARVGAALNAVEGVMDLGGSIVAAVESLLSDMVGTQFVFAFGEPTHLKIITGIGTPSSSRGKRIDIGTALDPIAMAARDGRSVECLGTERASAPWGFDPSPAHLFAIPLMARGEVRGAVVVGSSAPLPEDLKYALEVLAAKAAASVERIGAQEELRRMQEHFQSLMKDSSDVVTVLGPDGTIRYQTASVERLLGYHPEELIGTAFTDILHSEDTSHGLNLFTERGRTEGSLRTELRLRHRRGSYVTADVNCVNRMEDPSIQGLVLTMRDATERKALERQVNLLASRDSLTKLANRSFFAEHLQLGLEEGERNATSTTVLLVGLDDFKTVNDALGNAAGDQLLLEVSERLRGFLRARDILGRLGGDEFAIMLLETTESESVHVAERILASLEDPFALAGREVFLHASIGVAADENANRADELLRNATVAMHMAKTSGKARFEVFEPGMHERALQRLEMTASLRKAVENQAFSLAFQPLVNISTGDVEGAEALLRWRDPEKGPVSPAEFIPLAEDTGLIVPLGRWVLREACRNAKPWQTRNPNFCVSVNISVKQLVHSDLVGDLKTILEEEGVEPSSILLEITESVLMEDSDTTLSKLRDLKDLGVKLALDDFGTGYSSLGYLRNLPIDMIKIDKSFIDDIALVDAIIKIGKNLGMTTVAEGIEDEDQLARLARLGCELGQGFYFAKPLEPSGIFDLLTQHASEATSS
jgi:diguanylate cyclase (GGDEF)-like protein/PAS domain S-box-containing protein